jgi:integrase
MPRKAPRALKLETAASRKKLAIRRKPFWVVIGRNLSLGYRRCVGPGSWSVRGSGQGSEWVRKIAVADDLEAAHPPKVLDYWQAVAQARQFVRQQPGEPVDEARPLSVGDALDRYQRHLQAQGGDPYNAARARLHLGALLSKPVSLLSASDLNDWRDGLVAKGLGRASVNRTRNCLRAALTLASKGDKRITNRAVWQDDLPALPNATTARFAVLADDVVRSLVTASYRHDHALGLLMDVLAQTGCRPSQAVRIEVGDLDAALNRILVPRSGKGHSHRRTIKRGERVPCPIPVALARKLAEEAKGRAPHEPLLLRSTGQPWGFRRSDQYRKDFAAVVVACGLDPKETTPYHLRHSAVARSLLRGMPVALVANLTDTSEATIRRHYGKFIGHFGDEIARRALLEEPPAGNVVPLRS